MIMDSKKYAGTCTCGREHKMETVYTIVESGCLKELNAHMHRHGLDGFTVAVYDTNTYAATGDRHPKVDAEIMLDSAGLHADEQGVELLMQQLPPQTKVIIAVGAGTIHDIVRYCAYERGADFVSCPTAASVDGFCSSVASMTWHGCKKTLTAVAPKIVVADIDVIKKAPIRLARSGFGDMVGKYVALTDWKIAHILTGEFYCPQIAGLTLEATKAVVDSVDGILRGDEKAFENLTYGLLLSGLAMQMLGNSRPASGAEHHISHIIEMEPEGLAVHSDALHGEKVGVGTLLAIEEYRRLLGSTAVQFEDYQGFSLNVLTRVFGADMAKSIREENKKDAAAGITGQLLRKKWAEICEELAQLPDEKSLRALYERAGIYARLSDIHVPEEKAEELLQYSPSVRNRLTLMRLRRCL